MKKFIPKINQYSLCALSCFLYVIFHKYNDQILYKGYSIYYIYAPIFLIGIFVLRKKTPVNENKILYGIWKLILLFLIFYFPSTCIFGVSNKLYTKNKKPIHLEINKIKKIYSNVIIFKFDDEMIKSNCSFGRSKNSFSKKNNQLKAKLIYKEGLFGTYVVENLYVY